MSAENKFTFDWHKEPEGFLKWMIPNLITGMRKDKFEELSDATDSWRSTTLTIQINGVNVPVKNFLEGIERNMDWKAGKEAMRMLEEHAQFSDLADVIREAEQEAVRIIRSRLRSAGIELSYEDD